MEQAKHVLQTPLADTIDASDVKAKYDAQIKAILANKHILSWIMKHTMKEFKEMDILDIVKCIEGEVDVGIVPVAPGMTNLVIITGDTTESAIPNEGKVTFDIRFHVLLPDGKRTKIIINIEAQKNSNPGYDLLPRGIFYCARMLSAQLDQEFTTTPDDKLKYDGIKKVYSIWLCMDTQSNERDTIIEYHIVPNVLHNGNPKRKLKEHRHDIMSVVMVNLGDDDLISENKLMELLTTLLSSKLTTKEKKQILEEKFKIPMTIEFEQEVDEMCNLSEYVEERGIKIGEMRGIEIGEARGIEKAKIALVRNRLTNYSDEILADLYELDLKVVQDLRREYELSSIQ